MTQSTGVRFETIFLSRTPPSDDRVRRLGWWGRRFRRLGLAAKSAGNLSFRTRDGFVISGTGIALEGIGGGTVAEVVGIETEGGATSVQARGQVVPSKESVLHSGIYALRPDVDAVLHIHDQAVVDLADEIGIPCTEGVQPRGSLELAQEVGRLLRTEGDTRYIILREHGVISLGLTLDEAGRLAEEMNRRAREIAAGKGARDEGDTGV